MATLASNVLTLMDHAKRQDPKGNTAKIVELLMQSNPILEDMVWKEGNLDTGERVTIRTGLPTVFWRLLNAGVQLSKSTTAQVDEQTAMLEAWSEVDPDLASLGGDKAGFRLSEARAFVEAMNQEKAQTLIYGNAEVSPEEFTGFAVRYADKSANNAQNIVDAGGTGSTNSSIWLITWSTEAVYGIYPKGSKAGLRHDNYGEVTSERTLGSNGTRMRVLQDRWQWKCGLVLKDWRQTSRIANIDIPTLVDGTSVVSLTEEMIRAVHRIQNINMGKAVFYMNRSVFQFLDIERLNAVKDGGGMTYQNVDGKMIPHFRGIPIKVVDALVETEARVI